MKSLRAAYKTSDELETKGIMYEVANTRLRLARAGGANKAFNNAWQEAAQKNKRAVANNLLSTDDIMRIACPVYAEHVVLSWETNTGTETQPNWVSGIDDGNGGVIEATFENIVKAFQEMPDFFLDVKATAEDIQFYRASLIEGVTGK